MRRGGEILVLAHCLLNANSKVKGLASYTGALQELVLPAATEGYGFVQLPCPENTFLGGNRWGMTREQYDVPAYRDHCQRILVPVVDLVADHITNGYAVRGVVGVDGSPSCGVDKTCCGYVGGEIAEIARRAVMQSARFVQGSGIFVGILRRMFEERGLRIPFAAVDEEIPESCRWEALRAQFLRDDAPPGKGGCS